MDPSRSPTATNEISLGRRSWKVGLRTIFILIAVISAWLAYHVNRAHRQQAAAIAVVQAGGQVRYDYQPTFMEQTIQENMAASTGSPLPTYDDHPRGPEWLRRLIGDEYFQTVANVDIRGEFWKDDRIQLPSSTIQKIGALPELEELMLVRTNLSDADLPTIGRLKNLRLLVIRDSDVTDAGLVHLYSLSRLEQLNVINTKVTPDGVAKLQEHLPNCTVLQEDPAPWEMGSQASSAW
jgi:hypothetical protein